MKYRFLFFFLVVVLEWGLISSTSCMADMGGYVRTSGYYFTQMWEDKERLDMEVGLDASFPFYNLGEGYFSFKFYADDLLGKMSENKASIDEAYLDIYTRSCDIRLGRQYIFWGRTTGVNTPTNNINPQDLTKIKPDPEQMRVAVDALKINYFKGFNLLFQGVWMPGFVPSKLPSFLQVNMGEEEYPEPEFKNSSWGLKVDRFSGLGDFSFSYLYTWDDFPDYKIDMSDSSPQFIPVYHRVKIFGADFATGIGGFDVRGEIAHIQTEDERGASLYIKNPYLKYALETGYSVTDNVDVILQIRGKKIFHFKSASDYPEPLREIAEQLAFLYGEQKEWQSSLFAQLVYRMWHDRLQLELQGEYNLTLHDYFLSPKLSYDIGGGLNLGAGFMIFEGEPDTQSGAMDDRDFIWYELSYSF